MSSEKAHRLRSEFRNNARRIFEKLRTGPNTPTTLLLNVSSTDSTSPVQTPLSDPGGSSPGLSTHSTNPDCADQDWTTADLCSQCASVDFASIAIGAEYKTKSFLALIEGSRSCPMCSFTLRCFGEADLESFRLQKHLLRDKIRLRRWFRVDDTEPSIAGEFATQASTPNFSISILAGSDCTMPLEPLRRLSPKVDFALIKR